MKKIGVFINERSGFVERIIHGALSVIAFGFLALYDVRLIPLIVIAYALSIISKR